ncbi:RagB/SusD family nutrient uptake outer membrane protein [Niabella terrae]
MGEMYSDNVSDKGPNASGVHLNLPFPQLYKFEDVEDDGGNTPSEFWNGAYEGIAAANQALASIVEYDLGPETNPYRGEALVARAFSHFLLVTFFAKAYDPAGDNSSLGVPYVLTPEDNPFQKYDRGTVASVYEQIEKDLTEGLPLLNGGQWDVPGYHFTPAAAHAFAARFYLFKQDWQKVIEHANKVVPGGDFFGVIRDYAGEAASLSGDGTIFGNYFCSGESKFNLLVHEMYSGYQRSSGLYASRYGFGPAIYSNWYTRTNVTGSSFKTNAWTYGTGNYTLNKLREYFFVTNSTSNIGYPYLQMPMLTTDEVLLNRAEAYLEMGNTNAALADLNLACRYKITNYNQPTHGITIAKAKDFYDTANEKEAVMNAILDVKRWTFMNEGMRYFDMIRHKMTITHLLIDNSGVESTIELPADDNRRVFQIPKTAVELGGLELNPR